jgi:hypothetical protein
MDIRGGAEFCDIEKTNLSRIVEHIGLMGNVKELIAQKGENNNEDFLDQNNHRSKLTKRYSKSHGRSIPAPTRSVSIDF